ncbi:MAG: DUF3048 domain-containing protein [Chloroflexi bacterium]|nr:DUF3048 domain-containing protein [Chloroflexota bacterium]
MGLVALTVTVAQDDDTPPLDNRIPVTLPGTNTPRPFVLRTNTPSGPTATPSWTASPLPTNTPTNTPSATPTNTLTPTPSDTPTHTPSPTPTLVGPVFYPDGVSPLTGLPYPNDEALTRRNLIIKISNFPPIVRPQSGVNAADVVYEYEVEGGVTRFAAIFRNNTPDHVGPVRSARLTDLELVDMYQALLGYSGASEPIQNLIMSADWSWQAISPSRGDNCEEAGFCRFPREGLPSEHTLYANTELIWERATARGINTGYRAHGFAFSDEPDGDGLPANDVFVEWYGLTDARWQYDSATGRYLRFTETQPHIDAADGEQLWADNVVIIEALHQDRPDLFDPASSTASHQINLWGTGRAYLIRDGRAYQGFWERRCIQSRNPTPTPTPEEGPSLRCDIDPGDALRLYYGDNTPMMMKPGRTWVTVTRWLNYVSISEVAPDINATAAVLRLTPTNTPWPTPVPAAGS